MKKHLFFLILSLSLFASTAFGAVYLECLNISLINGDLRYALTSETVGETKVLPPPDSSDEAILLPMFVISQKDIPAEMWNPARPHILGANFLFGSVMAIQFNFADLTLASEGAEVKVGFGGELGAGPVFEDIICKKISQDLY